MQGWAERFRSGELIVCVCLTQARTPSVPLALAAVGVDAVYMDLEHTPMSLETASELCIASLRAGVVPLVRVPSHDGSTIGRALDGGAVGVIVPHVRTAEDAQRVVDAARMPPLGRRNPYVASPVLGYRRMPMADALAALEAETLVIAMIESRAGVENAEQIAAVAGIDMLLVGAFDLARDLGCEQHDRAFADAMGVVADACRRTGTGFGVLGLRDTYDLADLVGRGLRFVGAGTDLGLLQEAASSRVAGLRAHAEGQEPR